MHVDRASMTFLRDHGAHWTLAGAMLARDDRAAYGTRPNDAAVDPATFSLLDNLAPARLDREIARARQAGDVGHRVMAFYLADCADRGVHQQFGHPSVIPYAVKRHGLSRRTARDLVAAGRALRELSAIDAAFRDSTLTWSKTRAIASVATRDTEAHWIAYATTHDADDVAAEAARARKGDKPREDSRGLKPVRFTLKLRVNAPLHEQAVLARERLRDECGHEPTDDEFAGVLLESFLRRPAESERSADSLYRVVLDMRHDAASIRSSDGPILIDAATAAAIACDAGVVCDDPRYADHHVPPIPESLRRRILARDGHRCAVCGSKATLHVHHVVFRSREGSNDPANLSVTCLACHALIHEGFLAVEGAAPASLVFKDRGGNVLDDPKAALPRPGTTLSVTAPSGPAGPPVLGFSAEKEGVAFDTLPAEVDPRWLAAHGHLLAWNARRGALTIAPGMPETAALVPTEPPAASPTEPPASPLADPPAATTHRPTTFDDIVGQDGVKTSLALAAAAAVKQDRMPPPAILLGESGLGKTTLARAYAHALGGRLSVVDATTLDSPLTLLGHLMSARDRDVVFIDEIHALKPRLCESIYQALEDGVQDLPFTDGLRSKSVRLRLPKIAFVAATTNPELLPKPLLSRFVRQEELEPYALADLAEILRRATSRAGLPIAEDAAATLARASAGTARTALSLFSVAKDVAALAGSSRIDLPHAREALCTAGLDERGFNRVQRRVLEFLCKRARPVAIRRLAAWCGLTLEAFRSLYEPALMRAGVIAATPRGLCAT